MEYYIYKGEDEFYHWGIKGMKWGVRRFQNPDGSLTPRGEKRRARLEGKLEKLKGGGKKTSDGETETESVEAKKERILQSRSAKEIYKNANLFTTQELQAAKTRLMLEKDIASLAPAEVDKGKERVDKMKDSLDTAANLMASGGKAWNAFAGIYNSLYGAKKGITLPTISDKMNALEKYKDKTAWMKAEKERKDAEDALKPKEKTEIEKMKEKAEELETRTRLEKAESNVETSRLDSGNKRAEAERTSREHARKDEREAIATEKHNADLRKSKVEAERAKDEAKAAEAELKAERKAAREAKKQAKEQAKAAEESGKSFLEKLASGKSDSSSDSSNATSTGKDYVENSGSDIFKVAFDIWGVDDD